MLWDKKSNLMLEAFTSDIISTNSTYCIYYPESTEATFSITSFGVPDDDISGCYSYYFPNKDVSENYNNFDIKIRQNFGKQFTFITYLSIDSAGIFYTHSYSPNYTPAEGYYFGSLVLTTKSTPTEGRHTDANINDPYYGATVYRVKSGQIYMIASTFNWGSSGYFNIVHYLYNYSTKKQESYGGVSSFYVEDPTAISNKIPGLYLYCEDGSEINFYGLRAYSCSLTNDEILECLNASIYFTNSSSQLRAKKFNEYCSIDGSITIENDEHTHDYIHPTFYKDGTVFCSGQLIEGTTSQVDKNGNVKCQEFIEY